MQTKEPWRVWTLRCLGALLAAGLFAGELAASPSGSFLLLSDIHFDPYFDASLVPKLVSAPVETWDSIFLSSTLRDLSIKGRDTNFALFHATLAAIQANPKSFDFAIVPGDLLSHGFDKDFDRLVSQDPAAYRAFVLKTESYVCRSVQAALGKQPVFFCLGNNDSDCGDYAQSLDDPLFAGMAADWHVLDGKRQAQADFRHGGYYAVLNPERPGQEIVALNDIYWSKKFNADDCGPSGGDPAQEELKWLGKTLEEAKQEKRRVTLIMHIPPGIDAFSSSVLGNCFPLPKLFWRSDINDAFEALLKQYPEILNVGFAGHYHRDDFRILQGEGGKTIAALHVVPALSPIFGNRPAFQIFEDSKNGALLGWQTEVLHSLKSPSDFHWKEEYDAGRDLGMSHFDAAAFGDLANRLEKDPALLGRYQDYYGADGAQAVLGDKPTLSKAALCAQKLWNSDEYRHCACGR